MTPRMFFNAWIGYSENESDRIEAIRAITFGSARYNASRTAFSKEGQRAIANENFPWEKPEPRGTTDIASWIKSWDNGRS